MSEKVKFSTSIVEPRRRLDLWRAMLADAYSPVELKDYDAKAFNVDMETISVGDLSVTHVEAVPQTFVRPKTLIRSGDRDDYVAAIQLKTGIRCSIDGRDDETARDTVTLYDMGRPFICQCSDPCSSLDIHIPRLVFENVLGPVSSAVGLTIGREQACGSIIRAFFQGLMEHGESLEPATAKRVASIGVDLLVAGFAEKLAQEPRARASSATLVYRAKIFIEDHRLDVELDSRKVAAAVNLSVRRLQEIFAEQELTVDGHIWERRLAKAQTYLRDPAYGAATVASIGYAAGFNNPTHFTRRFSKRFAMTPTEYRHGANAALRKDGKRSDPPDPQE